MSDVNLPGIVLAAVIDALLSQAVTIGWDSLQHEVQVGSLVFGKNKGFSLITGTLKRLTGQGKDSRIQLLQRRNDQTTRLYTAYANEPAKMLIGNDIRVGYATQAWFIQNLGGGLDPSQLLASEGEDYDVDVMLGIENYQEIAGRFRAKKEPRQDPPYKGTAVRVSDWDGHSRLTLSRCFYQDQYVTNQKEIVDETIESIVADSRVTVPPRKLRTTLRDLNMRDGRMLSLNESSLANTIGIAGSVVTSDGYLVLPNRNRRVHFQSGYEGCSTSGVLEWSGGLTSDFMKELLHQLVTKEGPQEILLDSQRTHVTPLAFAREFERAGKPQFFFHIWTDQRLSEFAEQWKRSKYPAEEYDSIRWIELFEPNALHQPELAIRQATERLLALLSSSALISLRDDHQVVLSEEARASLYCLAIFLQAEQAGAFPISWRNR